MGIGLAVMRLQPLHKAHCLLIHNMCINCEIPIIGLGSSEVFNEWNPYSVEVRKQMLTNVFGNRIKIVPLNDIESNKGTNAWVNYVISKITKIGLPTPTHYYGGSESDAVWYKDYFKDNLSIMPRDMYVHPSASEIRTQLAANDTNWKKYIPEVNWNLVENNFPKKFKIL